MSENALQLGTRKIGPMEPVFVICEGGVTNYGEIELAKRQVDAAIAAKCDIVKFQVQKTESLVSQKVAKRLEAELGYNWYDRVKYKELSRDEVFELAKYVASGGWPFFATAHETESLDFLDHELRVPFFKVGSGEAHNFEFLKDVGSRGKPILISFGLQSDEEVLEAIETLKRAGASGIGVFHCTTLYPTPYDAVSLPRMLHLQKLTGLPVGISDHSVGWHVPLAAVALGACMVEKHITFDKDDPRSLDNPGALYPYEFKYMVRQIRNLEKALRDVPMHERLSRVEVGRDWAGQSLVAAQPILAGEILERAMITFKRPGKGGLPPSAIDIVIGRKARVTIEEDEQILESHLE